jgi:hypothetical protein
MIGLMRGLRFASQYGPWWALLGAVLGFIAGIVVAVARQNGTCRASHFESAETPLPVRKHVDGILYHAYRCKCGNLYTKIGCMSLKTQWVRILSDNTIQPYLKHRPFGRWKPDTSDRIEIPPDHSQRSWEIELYSTKLLRSLQEGLYYGILLAAVLSLCLIAFDVFLALASDRRLTSRFTTKEYLLLYFATPLMGGIIMFIVTCVNRRRLARAIEADGVCIRVQRFNKQQVEIEWEQIISAKYQKELNYELWILRTVEGKGPISAEGFLQKDWQLISDYIRQHIPESCQLEGI